MTTIFDHRPEIATAVADGSLGLGLPDSALASLRRINDKVEALTTPLTQVTSCSEAEALATASESEYRRLGEEWVGTLRNLDVSPADYAVAERENGPLVQRIALPDKGENEDWQGVLDSEEGYVAWAERQLIEEQNDAERQRNEILAEKTRGPFLRYLLVKRALVSAMASEPGPTSQTISALAEYADMCMTEVEDVFLASADYGEDDGERVSLEDVRANLGL